MLSRPVPFSSQFKFKSRPHMMWTLLGYRDHVCSVLFPCSPIAYPYLGRCPSSQLDFCQSQRPELFSCVLCLHKTFKTELKETKLCLPSCSQGQMECVHQPDGDLMSALTKHRCQTWICCLEFSALVVFCLLFILCDSDKKQSSVGIAKHSLM